MSTSYKPLPPISTDSFPRPVTALSFDPVSDILWAGTSTGDVSSFYSTQGLRGVSFPVGGDAPVKKLLAGNNYVRAHGLGSIGVGSWTKGGMNKWFYSSSADITSFSNNFNSSHILAAASMTSELLILNSMTGSVVQEIRTASVLTHLQFSHSSLLSGSLDGFLRVHDPRTGMSRSGGAESAVKAHANSIEGLQTSDSLAFTIGMGERQTRPFPDPLVKVYDLRTMRPLPPLPFSSSPAFIHILPKRTSSIAIVSNQGLVNVVDASNPTALSEFYQLDLASYLTSVSVSPTAAYMAFGDAEGVIHLLSQAHDSDEDVPFNGFVGQPVQWPDIPAPIPDNEWTDSTPLNTIGLPYYDNTLFSGWSPHFLTPGMKYAPAVKIPPQVLSSMKLSENVGYAPLPKEMKGRRNMVTVGPQNRNGRFRSGKSRAADPEPDSAVFDPNDLDVPRMYRQVEIEYSKFGVEDFDFGFYNKTGYSGLETHILNSYTNPMVQVMHYCRPIRHLAKSHITTDCPLEHCLLCELGFVSRMLEDARGTNCQSSNFCKTVGVVAQSSNAIELIDYGQKSADTNYANKIQLFHRFLIDRLITEGNTFPHNPLLVKNTHMNATNYQSFATAPITQILGIDGKNVVTCSNCKAKREKDNMTHVIDLIYPRKGLASELVLDDFASILRNSLLRNMTHKATCQTCKQFSNFTSRRSIPSKDLPPVLALNASVYNEESLNTWQDTRNETFLQPQISLHGQIEGVDDPEVVIYEIRALVIQVTAKEKHSHLVAIVKIPDTDGASGPKNMWVLFNDFVVRSIPEEEALRFPGKWKMPAIIYMERVDLNERIDYAGLPKDIDLAILNRDTSIALNRDQTLVRHVLLQPNEFPKPGTLVAIDAEFVSMQQEETEFRSDGTNKVLRPARLSLARVSVLRGEGSQQGVPFIDDHIHTSEVIVDYLTEFSGIKFGDLDPHTSRHTLTPLKLVYKKLRLLVDCGCIFIGHGLSKDFRIINIYVPTEQVRDTVDIYFLKARQRRLSLRFLSWFVLHAQIQTDMHDSIEDARSALELYNTYQELKSQGLFGKQLEDIYKEGRQYNYKPPPQDVPGPDKPSSYVPSHFLLGSGEVQISRTQSNSFEGRHIHSSNQLWR